MSLSTQQSYQSRWQNLMLKRQSGFFYERDAAGNFTFVSPEVMDTLGWTPDQFIHQWSSWAKNHSGESGSLLCHGQDSNQGELNLYRCKIPAKSGRMLWFEMVEQITGSVEEGGTFLEGFARDVTEFYNDEISNRSRENRFRQIMDFSPIGIFQTDAELNLAYVNTHWQVITRYPIKEVLGKTWFTPILEEGRENILENWQKEMEQNNECFFQCRILRPDSDIRWVEFRSRALFQDGGRVVFGTMEDITEHRVMANQLEEYTQELKRSNQDLESFATIASHDLKEPLRKIVAFGNRLNTAVALKNEEQSLYFLDRIQRSGERMQKLIEDLLQLSRITFEARPFLSVDFNQLLTEVISDLELLIQKSGAVVRLSTLPWLKVDEGQIRQLFQNLLGNALKFARDDLDPVITVDADKLDNGDWQFTIKDNGIGFDISNLDRIFKPFERLHGRSEFEGNGIGLAICKKIIDRHHGSLTADSEPGKGATFTFTLPGDS